MAGFLSFTGTPVPFSRIFPLAHSGRSVKAVDFAVKVSGLVRLLVQLEEEILHDRSCFPGNLIVVSIRYVDPCRVYASY